MIKSLHNTDQNTTQSNVKDVVFFGDHVEQVLTQYGLEFIPEPEE